MSLTSLAGKLALITGAASGIGASTAKLFAKYGADLVLADKSTKVSDLSKEILADASSNGHNIHITTHVCDVTNSSDVNTLFSEIKKHHSKHPAANIIVNSAGVARLVDFLKVKEYEFSEIIDINFKGTFLVTQAASRALIEAYPNFKPDNDTQSYASIINIASQAAKMNVAGGTAYSASKAAVVGFTRSTAKELGRYKIRVNSILPYFIETPMIDTLPNKNYFAKVTALGRFGKPEEVAQLCYFLASDAGSYVNGADIDIDGG